MGYSNRRCTNPSGVMYGKKTVDPYKDIDCLVFIDKAFVGATSPTFDDEFFDNF